MDTYIASKNELAETISKAVEKAVEHRLPNIIRKASRKEYYTTNEVCEMLDISRRHLQYLRDSGQIGYVKNGRKIYFKAQDLETFFEDNYIDSDQVEAGK